MIRNEAEYQLATTRLQEERGRLVEHRDRLKATGLSDDEIKRVIDPIESFHLQLKEEVEGYERLKRGEFDELENLRGLGQLRKTELEAAKGKVAALEARVKELEWELGKRPTVAAATPEEKSQRIKEAFGIH